jgi:3'-phosphoadenosine 5'-phosphosulfate sulfotransferase (PAPS reductase)/FAD synthetase
MINSPQVASILNQRLQAKTGGSNQRLAIMLGWYTKKKTIKANIPDEEKSNFSQERYKFFLDAPFEISNRCCSTMKKDPAHDYHKRTGRNPITAQMASESRLRLQKWLQNGCNGFNLKIPTSNPMSFWTEQDILKYIKENKLPICSVYGDVVIDYDRMGESSGQSFLFTTGDEPLKTTGCDRTGCVLCGFGCHLEKPGQGRFEMLRQTHPKFYNLLDICKNNGVTFREAIEWTNEHGNLNIRL